MTTPEIITQLLKTQTDGWAKENMSVIKAHVDRLFENAPDLAGTIRQNPVTGSSWLNGVDPIAPQKLKACRALFAREHFARFGPPDAPPLPVSQDERDSIKFGGLPYLVAVFARSWEGRDYDLEHPSFVKYACGVMASEHAPDYWKDNQDLRRRFPPRRLKGLGPGLVWEPPAPHAETMTRRRGCTAYHK